MFIRKLGRSLFCASRTGATAAVTTASVAENSNAKVSMQTRLILGRSFGSTAPTHLPAVITFSTFRRPFTPAASESANFKINNNNNTNSLQLQQKRYSSNPAVIKKKRALTRLRNKKHKVKTIKAAHKRYKMMADGSYKYRVPGRHHLMTKMNKRQKQTRFRYILPNTGDYRWRKLKQLMPYGHLYKF